MVSMKLFLQVGSIQNQSINTYCIPFYFCPFLRTKVMLILIRNIKLWNNTYELTNIDIVSMIINSILKLKSKQENQNVKMHN